MRKTLLLFFVWLLFVPSIFAQEAEITVEGTVTDPTGMPIPGVNVIQQGTSNGVATNFGGEFTIEVPSDAILEFSYLGYETIEIEVDGQTQINISMETSAAALEEVVVVGYGKQKRKNVTGSIATVDGEEISVAPVASTTNTLAGRLPGLISLQSSGQPGADGANLSIRGFGNPLVIVDGIEGNLNNLDANMIESISVLKDASAAVYGSRAGNGVILVTTKRGRIGKPIITFRTSQTWQTFTRMLEPPSAGQYTEMQSEEWLQAGRPADQVPYTPEEIQAYYAGTDPQYPNTNWHDEVFKSFAPMQNYDLSVRGGSDKIKFYGFLGYLDQESIWKKNGGGYERYNVKANIDAEILDNLSLRMDLASVVDYRTGSARGQGIGGAIWQDYWQTRPIYPATLPDPTKVPYAGSDVGGVHASSNMEIFGYDNSRNQSLDGTIALNYTFENIKGLSAKAFYHYDKHYSTGRRFGKPVEFYSYDYESDTYIHEGTYGNNGELDISKREGRVLTNQFSFNYDNTFAEDHHFTGLALYETIEYRNNFLSASRNDFITTSIDQLYAGSTEGMANSGSASEMGRKSFVGRLTYSFRDKYLLESTFRADASAKFPSNSRWGYFPSVSLGWVITQENFMKNVQDLDYLKLRTSYGLSGRDNVGNFQYLSGYSLATGYNFGGGPQPGLSSTGLPNPNLTWEEITIYNLGIDFSMWENKFYGVGNVFYRERKGIPANRSTSLPSSFGAALPPENLNSLNDRGFELLLGTEGYANDFSWDISANISWSRSKWDHFEEPDYEDPEQERIYRNSGRWTDRQYGYLSNGLFTSQEQIDELDFDQDQQGNATLRPGDIRYQDLNGDGVLDWRDMSVIGRGTTPNWMGGVSINLSYNNFFISSLFQGATGYSKNVKLTYNVGNLMRPSIIYDLRWTPTNNVANALEPRLGGAATNDYVSDYRYKPAGYLRLKAFSIGYNVPKKLLDQFKLNQVQISVSGTNLLTFNLLSEYGIDPEAPSGHLSTTFYYPQQKTFSLGLDISL